MKMRDKVMRILKNLSQLDEIDKDRHCRGRSASTACVW